MKDGYSVEREFKLYNDAAGYHFGIGPDRDGLGMVRIWYNDGKDRTVLLMTTDEARMFLEVMKIFLEVEK